MTSGPSPDELLVGQVVIDAFGGRRKINRYYDESESKSIIIVRSEDAPETGFESLSTVGVHRSRNLVDDQDIKVELAAIGRVGAASLANVLATAAFFVAKDHWLAAPGVVFPDLLDQYELGTAMHHVVWAGPIPWPQLGTVEIRPGLTVHWLVAVPIYDSERDLINDAGFMAFERLMEDRDVDIADLGRPSIL